MIMPYFATDSFGPLSISYYPDNTNDPFTAKESSDQNEPHFAINYTKGTRLYFRLTGTAGQADFTDSFFTDLPYGQTEEELEQRGYSYRKYDWSTRSGHAYISPDDKNQNYFFEGYISNSDELIEPTETYKIEFYEDSGLTRKLGETREYTIPSSFNKILSAPPAFENDSADIITNFNPKSEKLQIALETFDGAIDELKIARKEKQFSKLIKRDVDFIYNQQTGQLFFNENGRKDGFGNGGIFAILEGSPTLGLGNFEFI